MLKKLSVSNFAIIEDISVEFNNGMSVLTGETGAGKSLIIDTILLLLGGRADSDMIRYGMDLATIVGEFVCSNPNLIAYIKSLGISIDKDLIIKREIRLSGKNTIYVNNQSITLQILKNIANMLADIHVQNDTFKLFASDNYLDFIDPKDEERFIDLFNKYTILKGKYDEEIKKYNYIKDNQNKSLERLEFLKYECNELEELNLTKDIDIQLEEEINRLKNFDKIYSNLKNAYENLESEYFSIDNIYDAGVSLGKIEKYSAIYSDASQKINDAYYILDEVKGIISKELQNMDFDQAELTELESRHLEITRIKEKYKRTVNELIDYLAEIKLQLALIEDYDVVLKESYDMVVISFDKLVKVSMALTKHRINECKKIEKAIVAECNDLELPNVDFEIAFNEVDYSNPLNNYIFTDNGVDSIEFLISLNKGEPKKSLAKVASGGEMSRIMLAFKTYFSKSSKLELMVFDEIDTGISGSAAVQIAKKMHQISENVQILCITHLPQVAAMGDYHYYIYKVFENERTKTQIEILDIDKRIEQIAIMLSGNRISKYALEHAKELIENKE